MSTWVVLITWKQEGTLDLAWSFCLAPLWVAVLMVEGAAFYHLIPLRRWIAPFLFGSAAVLLLHGLKKDVLPGSFMSVRARALRLFCSH